MEESEQQCPEFARLQIKAKLTFTAWIDPSKGGFRFKRDERRSKTWNFGCRVVAWQAGDGPVVRKNMFIRKERLDDAMALRLIRQTPKGRVVQFTGYRPDPSKLPSLSSYYIQIAEPITKPDRTIYETADQVVEPKKSLKAPKDRMFGAIKWDSERERFEADLNYQGSDLTINFHAQSNEELKDLLVYAKPLWKDRKEWFDQWRKAFFQYYVRELRDEWYEGEEPLDEKRFNEKIDVPASIDFFWDAGEPNYMITGMDDDLVGDHALEAHGTEMSPDKIYLT